MKEIRDIIKAYDAAKALEKKIALATVVKVDGSAYRRPGARMLITEDGELTGAISGGCLEGDALRKAQNVIFQQKPMLVTYDTTDEDDQKFGVGLGCNGIIHVLIEPIDATDPYNPLLLLKISQENREAAVMCTIFSLKNSRDNQVGSKLLYKHTGMIGNLHFDQSGLIDQIETDIKETFNERHNSIIQYPQFDDLNVFYESLQPPVRIILFGAGNDTIPLAKLAAILGMEIILVDGRKNYATAERFPSASQIIIGKADEALAQIATDQNTVALLMTHNFEYEATALEHLLKFSLSYIGILGPKKKTVKLLERLEQNGFSVDHLDENIFAPIGLDLGAETPEEIALSILAEIQAVLKKKTPIFLKDKIGPIHSEERLLNQPKHVI